MFLAIDHLRLGYEAREEAFRRMVFNIISANCDDHTKNHSFILPEEGGWELAPAYDVTYAHNPQGEWTSEHLMGVNGRFDRISLNDLLSVANRFGIGTARKVVKQVAEAVAAWPDFAAEARVSGAESKRITGHLRVSDFAGNYETCKNIQNRIVKPDKHINLSRHLDTDCHG